jgi:hypothetical protein
MLKYICNSSYKISENIRLGKFDDTLNPRNILSPRFTNKVKKLNQYKITRKPF